MTTSEKLLELINRHPPATGDQARLLHLASQLITETATLRIACGRARDTMKNMPQGSYRYATALCDSALNPK